MSGNHPATLTTILSSSFSSFRKLAFRERGRVPHYSYKLIDIAVLQYLAEFLSIAKLNQNQFSICIIIMVGLCVC